MKTNSCFSLFAISSHLMLGILAGSPVRNIQVTLRGKKFDVEEATTAKDVLGQMKEVAGVGEGRLLFGGKQLAPTDDLEEMGVKEGDSLQMLPESSTTKKKKKKKTSTVVSSAASAVAASSAAAKSEKQPESGGTVGAAEMEEFAKTMGEGKMPDMKESMDMMTSMMNNPMFQEYMRDPEKLEASRQMILNNPLMKQMLVGMPGMQEILEDKDAWREAMMAASNLYQNMDPEQLKEAFGNMQEGMGGMGGMGGLEGLFGNNDESAAPAALDELSEGED